MATFETGRILTAARFGLVAALATLLVSSVPYMFGFLATPPDRVYLGLMFDAPDHAQYWSWVTASRDGLFIPNTMTPEPNAANFLNPIMWALAKLQAIFNLSFAALFQWWRLAAAIVMGPALAVATALLSRGGAQARTAFWIALLGGGVGWTLVVVKYALGSPDVPFPQAVYTVEPNTWFGLLGYPYMPLAQGLVLTALAGAFLAHVRGAMWAHVACALGAAGTALVHAYDLVIVYVVLGASWGLEVWRTRQIPRGLTVAIAIAVGASAPLALYYQRLTSTDPLWQAVLAQYVNAGVWTPNPPLLVVLLGAPLLLALWRLAAGLNWSDPGLRFTACWVVAGTVLAYAPTVFQVKLLAALHVPLAILAADVWHERAAPWIVRLVKRAGAAGVASWAPAVVLAALVLPTNLYLFAWRLVELRRPDSSYYLTVDEAAALEALAARSGPDDVALALEDVGRWIPNYGRTRAFLAHWSMTNRYLQRRDDVAMFFSTRVDDAWRARLLAQDRVTFVVWTARRAAEGLTYDPASSPLFEPLFVSKTAGVFRVRGD